jgi:hypothetical protein
MTGHILDPLALVIDHMVQFTKAFQIILSGFYFHGNHPFHSTLWKTGLFKQKITMNWLTIEGEIPTSFTSPKRPPFPRSLFSLTHLSLINIFQNNQVVPESRPQNRAGGSYRL